MMVNMKSGQPRNSLLLRDSIINVHYWLGKTRHTDHEKVKKKEKKHVDSTKKAARNRKKEMFVMFGGKKDVIGVITVISNIDFMCFAVCGTVSEGQNKKQGKD